MAKSKKALGIVECTPEEKTKSAKTAMIIFKSKYLALISNAAFNGSSSKSLLIKE